MTTTPTTTELVGLAEISELYGVPKATAATWTRRRDFPAPEITFRMGPAWRRSDVIAWRRPGVEAYRELGDQPCLNCGVDDSLWLDEQAQPAAGHISLRCCFCEHGHRLTFNKGIVSLSTVSA